jgi:hypothetical protein
MPRASIETNGVQGDVCGREHVERIRMRNVSNKRFDSPCSEFCRPSPRARQRAHIVPLGEPRLCHPAAEISAPDYKLPHGSELSADRLFEEFPELRIDGPTGSRRPPHDHRELMLSGPGSRRRSASVKRPANTGDVFLVEQAALEGSRLTGDLWSQLFIQIENVVDPRE